MPVSRLPTPELRNHATRYFDFAERTDGPKRRREGPGADVVVILSFEDDWWIDGERQRSFVGGLTTTQVTSVHAGRARGVQLNLTPAGAYALFRVPLHELSDTVVPFVEDELVEQLAEARGPDARFALLDRFLGARLADAPAISREVAWAWTHLRATHGRVRIGAIAAELGWSRKRVAARFRDEVGLPPKSVARVLRFERARELALRPERMSWAEIAYASGYYDQSHLVNEFRAVTGRSPETFLQDAPADAA